MFAAIEKQLFQCQVWRPVPKYLRNDLKIAGFIIVMATNCAVDITAAVLSYDKYATDLCDHRITVRQLSKNRLFQFALELEARSASCL